MDLDKVDLMTQIDSLKRGWLACEAERDALAKHNLELRGALEAAVPYIKLYIKACVYGGGPSSEELRMAAKDQKVLDAALSLPLPAAAERVKVERELADAVLARDDWKLGELLAAIAPIEKRVEDAIAALRAARGAKPC